MAKNDVALARGIKNGNKRYFKKLYGRYHKQSYYVAKRYLKDDDLARDAIQDVFLKLWDKRQTLDESYSIKGLLFTMIKNHVLNMLRKEKNREKVVKKIKRNVQNRELRNTVEEKIIYSEYEKTLKKALMQLSPAKREVFKLKNFEGLNNAEVADKRNVSKHTVKTQYYLSSKLVRNYLKKHAGFIMSLLLLMVH